MSRASGGQGLGCTFRQVREGSFRHRSGGEEYLRANWRYRIRGRMPPPAGRGALQSHASGVPKDFLVDRAGGAADRAIPAAPSLLPGGPRPAPGGTITSAGDAPATSLVHPPDPAGTSPSPSPGRGRAPSRPASLPGRRSRHLAGYVSTSGLFRSPTKGPAMALGH